MTQVGVLRLAWLRNFIATPPWPDECVIWPGKPDPAGYGKLRFDGRTSFAHRIAYLLAFGPIPKGLQVNHRCKQSRACVNPAHLYAGSQKENCADRQRDGTVAVADAHGARTKPDRHVKGERTGTSKLTEAAVRQIREGVANGEPQMTFVRRFGVSKTVISYVVKRKSWAHVA